MSLRQQQMWDSDVCIAYEHDAYNWSSPLTACCSDVRPLVTSRLWNALLEEIGKPGGKQVTFTQWGQRNQMQIHNCCTLRIQTKLTRGSLQPANKKLLFSVVAAVGTLCSVSFWVTLLRRDMLSQGCQSGSTTHTTHTTHTHRHTRQELFLFFYSTLTYGPV